MEGEPIQGEATGGNTTNGEQTGNDTNESWFKSILSAIGGVFDSVKEMASYLNPGSENFILRGTFENLVHILDFLDPLNDNFIMNGSLGFLSGISNYLNPNSDSFILSGVAGVLGGIFDYVNPFSENFFAYKLLDLLADLLRSLFVMSEEQEIQHEDHEQVLKSFLEGRFNIVSFFNTELEKAKTYISSDDFLNIKIPALSLDLGIINYSGKEINFTAVKEAYEPYRLSIRNSLFLIVCGMGAVYIVKYFLNYAYTSSYSPSVKSSKGDDE